MATVTDTRTPPPPAEPAATARADERLAFRGPIQRLLVRPEIGALVGTTAVWLLFWSVADGVLFRFALRFADSSFRQLDELTPAETAQPFDPLKTGSAASLVGWQDLGRMGRSYVASGPGAADISTLTGRPALEPLRAEFVKYVLSKQGQQAVIKDGYFPITAAIAEKDAKTLGLESMTQ